MADDQVVVMVADLGRVFKCLWCGGVKPDEDFARHGVKVGPGARKRDTKCRVCHTLYSRVGEWLKKRPQYSQPHQTAYKLARAWVTAGLDPELLNRYSFPGVAWVRVEKAPNYQVLAGRVRGVVAENFLVKPEHPMPPPGAESLCMWCRRIQPLAKGRQCKECWSLASALYYRVKEGLTNLDRNKVSLYVRVWQMTKYKKG